MTKHFYQQGIIDRETWLHLDDEMKSRIEHLIHVNGGKLEDLVELEIEGDTIRHMKFWSERGLSFYSMVPRPNGASSAG